MRRLNLWQGDRMTRRQVGEEVRSLAVKWVEEAQCLTDRQDIRRKVGEEVRSLAVKWVEETQSVAERQDDKKTSG